MVIEMNKKGFFEELSLALNYDEEQFAMIVDILDNSFFISITSKGPVIESLMEDLNIDVDEATYIYDVAVRIAKDRIKEKITSPFKNLKQ